MSLALVSAEEIPMRRNLALLVLVWLSACSIQESPESGPQTQVRAVAPEAKVRSEPETADAARNEPASADATVEEAKTQPSGDEEDIRAMQARLTTAGFNPGPIDGILGAKTKTALARLESACEKLADLLLEAAVDQADKSGAGNRVTSTGLSNPPLTREAVRVLQVRLKEAGFDPGALDGIAGSKTKAALARLESACVPRP
jgi:peptidoglycan hydrolase-like protein with peptidoglycan-binding domain